MPSAWKVERWQHALSGGPEDRRWLIYFNSLKCVLKSRNGAPPRQSKIFLTAVGWLFITASGMSPLPAPAPPPFLPGESATYELTYLGATAGRITLAVAEDPAEKDWLGFSADASTDPVFSLLYRVENRYQSKFDLGREAPRSFGTEVNEKKRRGSTLATFDGRRGSVVLREEWEKKGAPPEVTALEIPAGIAPQDVLSAFFYLRSRPLQRHAVYKFPVLIGREVVALSVEVTGEENLSTRIGNIPAWILTPTLLKDGLKKEIPETNLWIGKEGSRPLLKIKAKVKIGSVILYLKKYERGAIQKGS